MGLGPLELALLAGIALLFFGPSKLPQLGKSAGEAIRGFKKAMDEVNAPSDTNTPSTGTAHETAHTATDNKQKTETPNSATDSETDSGKT
jgi:sec-independent protein translocase protein TatA